MKVRNRKTGLATIANKQEDGSYIVDDKSYTREEMGANFEIIKEPKPKSEPKGEDMIQTNSWQSDELGKLALALSKAKGEFGSIDKSTEAYNYKYATIAATLNMVRPILSKHKIALVSMNVTQVLDGVLMTGVKTMLIHDGEFIASESYLPTEKTKSNNIAQVQGSWQSYQRRYNIMSMLNLATEDKDAKV